MVVALIPARGGSKRLPGKNVRLFGGRPLIAYSIALARSVSGIDRCVVSTDDKEIAEVARRWGAEVIDRPAELATDTATTASAARHAVERIVAGGAVPSALVTLQPTNPLRTVEMVEEGLALFLARRPDSVVSVAPVTSKTGSVRNGFYLPDYIPGTRSQDLQERVHETGQLYVSDAALVLERGELFGTRMLALQADPRFASADIDTSEDFELAESLYERHRHQFTYMDNMPAPSAFADIAHA
jgi:N-acylneuraminate cytidylyltransferase